MEVNAKRAFELLNKLSFERVSCTAEETRTAEALLAEIDSFTWARSDIQREIEVFKASTGTVTAARLIVTEPYEKEYPVTAYLRSDSTPDDGLELELVYVENALPANLLGVEGKAVLVNGRFGFEAYGRIQKAKPAAIIGFTGNILDKDDETDHGICKIRETYTAEFGDNILVNLKAKDALEIVSKGAKKVKLFVSSTATEGESRNVCVTLRGTDLADEIVSFGAHYDSVLFSTGAYDNMSGSVIIMELLRYFAANPPRRTLKFNWFGSEEQGLLGSKAYVAAHEAELEKHRLMVNVVTLRGTDLADEIVSFGAHYDSVLFSTGAYDNMSGSVIIMELLRYFAANPPRRTLKFNWFGSEEQGLLGSKAYVAAHEAELEKHRLMVNVDMAGPVLGSEHIFIMGDAPMKSYVEGMMNELGAAVVYHEDVYSSDGTPFSDKGIPAINFTRVNANGTGFIHDRRDALANGFLSADALGITLNLALEFSKRVVNAPIFPIERKISDSMRDKIDKYLFRKCNK